MANSEVGVTIAKAPVLEARAITKTFGRVRALSEATFVAHAGEVSVIVGDNGAGRRRVA